MPDWLVPAIIAFIGGGGAAGAITALIKVRPETGQIVVSAAQGAVVIQSTVIDNLEEEVGRQKGRFKEQGELLQKCFDEIQELRGEVAHVHRLEARVEELTDELEKTKAERSQLAAEKAELEGKVRELSKRLEQVINGEIPKPDSGQA